LTKWDAEKSLESSMKNLHPVYPTGDGDFPEQVQVGHLTREAVTDT